MSYSSEVLADSPVGYWRLGEASGTVAQDETANNRDGTFSGSPTLGAAGVLVGDANTAVTLDGTNDLITIADNAAWSMNNTNAFTLELWVKPSSTSFEGIIGKSNVNNQYEWELWWDPPSSNARFTFYTGTSTGGAGTLYTRYGNTGKTTGVWYHVVITCAGPPGSTVPKMYVDGVEQTAAGSAGSGGTYTNGTSAVEIGGRSIGATYWNGSVDEVAVYNTALSQARIQAHYDAGLAFLGFYSAITADSPLAHFKCNETSGNLIASVGTTVAWGGTTGLTQGAASSAIAETSKSHRVSSTADAWANLSDTSSGAYLGGNIHTANALTIECVIKASSTFAGVVVKQVADSTGWGMFHNAPAVSGWRMMGFVRGVYFNSDRTTDLAFDTWYHLVYVYDGAAGTVKWYVNGVENTTRSFTPFTWVQTLGTTSLFQHGGFNAGRLKGADLDELVIYKSALSPARIEAHAAALGFATATHVTVTATGPAVIDVAGQAFTVDTTAAVDVVAGAATIDVAGQAYTVDYGATVTAGEAVIDVAGQDAAVVTDQIVEAGEAVIDLTGQEFSTSMGVGVTAGSATVAVQGNEYSLVVDSLVEAGAAVIAIVGHEGAAGIGTAVVVDDAALVELSGQPYTLIVGTGAVIPVGEATLLVQGQAYELFVESFISASGPAVVQVLGLPLQIYFTEVDVFLGSNALTVTLGASNADAKLGALSANALLGK